MPSAFPHQQLLRGPAGCDVLHGPFMVPLEFLAPLLWLLSELDAVTGGSQLTVSSIKAKYIGIQGFSGDMDETTLSQAMGEADTSMDKSKRLVKNQH